MNYDEQLERLYSLMYREYKFMLDYFHTNSINSEIAAHLEFIFGKENTLKFMRIYC